MKKTAPAAPGVRAAVWLSRVLVAVSLLAALLECRLLYPQLAERLKAAAGLDEGGKTIQTFAAMKQALQDAESVRAVFAQLDQVLGDVPD